MPAARAHWPRAALPPSDHATRLPRRRCRRPRCPRSVVGRRRTNGRSPRRRTVARERRYESLGAVVEHDGRQQRGEVIVDDARDESFAGAIGDGLTIEIVVIANLVDTGEPEYERTDA